MDSRNFNLIDKIVARMRMAKILPYIQNGDEVLDFGCGNQGYLLRLVSKKIKTGVGVDYDVNNTDEGNISLRSYKFNNKLPFDDNSFNKIIMLAVLEHIELDKVDLLFNEFDRILKRDGRIILTTPTPKGKPWLEFLSYNLHVISEREIKDHKKYYDKNDIEKLIKKCNLRMVSYKLFQLGLNSCVILKK